jgi:hypothetical protein
MRVSAYLIVEPIYDYAGQRVMSGKITGVRQRKPSSLDNEAQAIWLHLEVPTELFDSAIAVINVTELPPREIKGEVEIPRDDPRE